MGRIKRHTNGLLSLMPLIAFLGLYLGGSIILGDFYKIPITVAFLFASVVALLMAKGSVSERVNKFSQGASDKNILLMVWIFVMAGAFAQSAKAIGAVDATVNLTLHILPESLLFVGIFVAACFVSLSVGTSVGTIVALVPIAAGIAEHTGSEPALVTAIVVGGALFGDNLSFISDTTIAATQTLGCKMSDKFKANILIVLPAAIIVSVIYFVMGMHLNADNVAGDFDWVKVIPYLAVIVLSIAGLNVMIVLLAGIVLSAVVGLATGTVDVWQFISAMGTGISGMGELIIVTLLAGGMLQMIRVGGGIGYIISLFENRLSGKRGAELVIATLVSLCNMCTANNTIAIITVGPIAKDIADKFRVDPRKAASILDTFSCFVQGIIPYGAQMLMASSLAALSPIAIIGHLYYPFLIGVFGLLAIVLRWPKRYS
ncbi:MAG: Na+/H+ antiporter NhaC family protein [Bacteroidales bacterium]|nr:Na+/H+ antiporter NhaC family protein [Bacteroidales bacterium]